MHYSRYSYNLRLKSINRKGRIVLNPQHTWSTLLWIKEKFRLKTELPAPSEDVKKKVQVFRSLYFLKIDLG
jgi:hypothetical protein